MADDTPRIIQACNGLHALNNDAYIRRKFGPQLQTIAGSLNDLANTGHVGNVRWRVGLFNGLGSTYLLLAQDDQIETWQKRTDFVQWVSP